MKQSTSSRWSVFEIHYRRPKRAGARGIIYPSTIIITVRKQGNPSIPQKKSCISYRIRIVILLYCHQRRRVRFHVDNEVVRYALVNRTCRAPRIMKWLRVLYALEERYDFEVCCSRISSTDNVGADAISRQYEDALWRQRLESWRPTIRLQSTPVVRPPPETMRL